MNFIEGENFTRKRNKMKNQNNKRPREEAEKTKLQRAESLLEKKHDEQEEEEEDDGVGSDNDYVDMNDDEDEELQVDFDVNIPNFQRDYFGVELFLRNYLNGQEFDFVKLTELVLGDEEKDEPNPLTSVIKIPYEEDEEQQQQQQQQPQQKDMEDEEEDATRPQNDEEWDPEQWDWNQDTYGFITCLDYRANRVCIYCVCVCLSHATNLFSK
jgi:hypothetical protein